MAIALVVDGDPDSRAELVQSLSQSGWEVQACATAAEALHRLTSITPDVMVTEVHLPDLPAWDLVPRVRALDVALPIVALTTDDSWETSRRVRVEAGPVFYYGVKPVDAKELQRVTSSAARWRHRYDPAPPSLSPKADPWPAS